MPIFGQMMRDFGGFEDFRYFEILRKLRTSDDLRFQKLCILSTIK